MECTTMGHIDNEMLLGSTVLLDYDSSPLQRMIRAKHWDTLTTKTAVIHAVYTYVRDEIPYGFPESNRMPASHVLEMGFGNCMSKSILLMALLRALLIPCRFHADMVRKDLYRGLSKGLAYHSIPSYLHHAKVDILYNNRWIEVEGHIIDLPYLKKLQLKFPDYTGSFTGYGIAVLNFKNPPINWEEANTYIQNKAKEKDLGCFTDPDAFFNEHPEAERFTQGFIYTHLLHTTINKKIEAIRTN